MLIKFIPAIIASDDVGTQEPVEDILMFWLGEEIGNGCGKERDAANAAKEETYFEIKS